MQMLEVIGHAAIDRIIRGNRQYQAPGGPPTYCSFYLKQVGIEVIPTSVVGYDFKQYLKDYVNKGINIDNITVDDKCRTTSYEITYIDDGRRIMRLLARCRDITTSDIKSLGKVVVVNPIAREIGLDVLTYIRDHVDFLGIDVQGFTRDFLEGGLMINKASLSDLIPIMGYADVIKISADDVAQVSINELMKFRDKFMVISRGPNGATLIHEGRVYQIDVSGAVNAVDPTGAGDVMTCSLTYLLSKGDDVLWSLAYSSALSLIKTLGEGPYGTVNKDLLEDLVEVLRSRIKPI